MADIFISYAREDRATAKAVASVLAGHGWSVWWDPEIRAGSEFDRVIETEIDSARCVVVLWSRYSSSSDWVRAEANEGAIRGVLVPGMLEDVTVPLRFRKIQTVDLRGWEPERPHEGIDELLRAIAETLKERAASVQPTPGVGNWQCELTQRTPWTRLLRLRRAPDTRMIYFRQQLMGDVVLVDGQTAWKGDTGGKRTLQFDISIGGHRYPALIYVDTNLATSRIRTLRFEVEGVVVYQEGV